MYLKYRSRVLGIKKRLALTLEKEYSSLRHRIISSCVQCYIPNILSQVEIDELIEAVLINQSLAWEEQKDLELFEEVAVVGDIPAYPTIYVSFHISSYRLALLSLLFKVKEITLIASKEVIDTQFREISDIHQQVTGYPITIIDANDVNSLYQMKEHLNRGRSLFVYLDGNTGADGMSAVNKNLLEVAFLSSSILVRKGVPLIAYLCGVGITPIMCRRSHETQVPYVVVSESLHPIQGERRDEYISRVLIFLYSRLSDTLVEDPSIWEGWLYLYKFMPRKQVAMLTDVEVVSRMSSNMPMEFNSQEYFEYRTNSEYLVINRSSLEAYELSHLGVNFSNISDISSISLRDIEELVKRRILV